jgi:hypothetical protein
VDVCRKSAKSELDGCLEKELGAMLRLFVLVFVCVGTLFAFRGSLTQVSDVTASLIVGGDEEEGGGGVAQSPEWGHWLQASKCELVDSRCMGPAYPCSAMGQGVCGSVVGTELGAGPNQDCKVVGGPNGLNAHLFCRRKSYRIGELQFPCASFFNCAWSPTVGCHVTINGPAPKPLGIFAPKDCEDNQP